MNSAELIATERRILLTSPRETLRFVQAHWRLLTLLVLSISLTALYLYGRPYILYNDGDPLTYFRKAWFLIGHPGGMDVPSRGPGYPLWLIATGAASLNTWWGLVASQIAMAVLAPLLFYGALRPFSRNAAFAGALLFTLFGIAYQYMNWVMTEQLCLFVELLAFCLIAQYLAANGYDRGRFGGAYVIALLLAYDTMVKPAAAPFFWVFVLVCLVFRVGNWRRYIGPVILFMLLMLGWSSYDYSHSPVWFPQLAQPSTPTQRNFADLYYGSDAAAAVDGTVPTIASSDGPASARLYGALERTIAAHRQSGKWNVANEVSVQALYGRFSRDEDLLNNIFVHPNPIYFELILEAAAGDGGDRLLAAVAREHGQAGFRAYLSYLVHHPAVALKGPPNPYVGFMFFIKYYRALDYSAAFYGARDLFTAQRKDAMIKPSNGPASAAFVDTLSFFAKTFPQYLELPPETIADFGGPDALAASLADATPTKYSGATMGWIYQWFSLLYGEGRSGQLMGDAALETTLKDPLAPGFLFGDFLSAMALWGGSDELFGIIAVGRHFPQTFAQIEKLIDTSLAETVESGRTTLLPPSLARDVGTVAPRSGAQRAINAALALQYALFKWLKTIFFFAMLVFPIALMLDRRQRAFVGFLTLCYFLSAAAWVVVMIMTISDPRQEEMFAFMPLMILVLGLASCSRFWRAIRRSPVVQPLLAPNR